MAALGAVAERTSRLKVEITVRLATDMRMAIVASADYLHRCGTPTSAHDLLQHNCITLRLAGSGGLYAWEPKKGERELQQVRVGGQAIFTGAHQMVEAARAGCGPAFVPEDLVWVHLQAGSLRSVLTDWCPVFPGLHPCYPRARQSSRTLALVIDAIRWRG